MSEPLVKPYDSSPYKYAYGLWIMFLFSSLGGTMSCTFLWSTF